VCGTWLGMLVIIRSRMLSFLVGFSMSETGIFKCCNKVVVITTEHNNTLFDPILSHVMHYSFSNVLKFLTFKPDYFNWKYGYTNEQPCSNKLHTVDWNIIAIWFWRMLLMKCVILTPRHSSESQESTIQPKWWLYVIANDYILLLNSEKKFENETGFVTLQKHVAHNQISPNTWNRDTKLIVFFSDC
jgi:hypothetical protein